MFQITTVLMSRLAFEEAWSGWFRMLWTWSALEWQICHCSCCDARGSQQISHKFRNSLHMLSFIIFISNMCVCICGSLHEWIFLDLDTALADDSPHLPLWVQKHVTDSGQGPGRLQQHGVWLRRQRTSRVPAYRRMIPRQEVVQSCPEIQN